MTNILHSDANVFPFDRYLVRPKMEEGESLGGFLYRFYAANGLNVPSYFKSLLASIYIYECEDQEKLNQLQLLLTSIHYKDEYNDLKKYANLNTLHKFNISEKSIFLARHRYCPKCIAEKPVHYTLWNLPMLTSCPKHRCQMAYICNQCKFNFNFSQLEQNWKCRCGYAISENVTLDASKLDINVTNLILSAKDSSKYLYNKKYLNQNQKYSYSLNDVYSVLESLHSFRIHLKLLMHDKASKVILKPAQINYKHSIGYRELKLILQTPTTKRLRKIASRLVGQNQNIIENIRGYSTLIPLRFECEYLINYKDSFASNLFTQLQQFINEYLSRLQNQLTQYVNTPNKILKNEFSIYQFDAWWRQVLLKINNIEKVKLPIVNCFSANDSSEELVEKIIKKMIKASQIEGSIDIYSYLFQGWPFPENLMIDLAQEPKPEKLLAEFVDYFDRLKKHRALNYFDERVDYAEYRLVKN